MLVFLDRQHTGKPNRWKDCGAVSPGGVQEIYLTDKYIHYAQIRLRDQGIDVCVLSDGHYSERHERVNRYAQTDPFSVYIACHINAGGGAYSAAFYDYRSSNGENLAKCINDRLNQRVQQFNNPRNTREIKAQPGDWTKNAYYTIKGVAPVAICWEPFFIDNNDHADLMTDEGLKNLGQCLADGIKTYFIKKGAVL